jgi:hypothetical protein
MGAASDVRGGGSRARSRASRHYASLAVAVVLAFVGSSWAGPVREGSVDSGVEGADQASTGIPALRAPLAGNDATASTALTPLMPAAAAEAGAASSATAMAVEIMKEAATNTRGSEPPHHTQRANTQTAGPARAASSTGQERTRPAEGAWDLREMGKAAVVWMKRGVPWLSSEADEENEAEQTVSLEKIDWSSLDGAAAAGGSRTAVTPLSGTGREAPRDPLSTVGYGNSVPPGTAERDLNVLRWIIDVIRPVIEHPMTWLVVSLFVIGAIVVKKIDRRPMK